MYKTGKVRYCRTTAVQSCRKKCMEQQGCSHAIMQNYNMNTSTEHQLKIHFKKQHVQAATKPMKIKNGLVDVI